MNDWTPDDTERWLNDYPLPRDFVFPPLPPGVRPVLEGRDPGEPNQARAWPLYQVKKGYGFWLRTAGPYHKPLRGLYALVHEIFAGLPIGAPMPTSDELAVRVLERAAGNPELPFTFEDNAPRQAENPAEGEPLLPDDNDDDLPV
jgi:hypothetical protein